MNLDTAMADALLRAILARPLLSTVSDNRVPGELWDAAYAYNKTLEEWRRATKEQYTEWEIAWFEQDTDRRRYYDALHKYSDILPEILKNSETENE